MDRAVVTHIDEGWELGFLLGVPWWEGILTKITKNCKKIAKILPFQAKQGGGGGGGMPIFGEVSGGMGVLPVPSSRLHPGEYDIEGVQVQKQKVYYTLQQLCKKVVYLELKKHLAYFCIYLATISIVGSLHLLTIVLKSPIFTVAGFLNPRKNCYDSS